MTHEELLYQIDQQIRTDTDIHLLAQALRAVVELHKPAKNNEDMEDEYPENDGIGCRGCGYDYDYMMWSVAYPCPTIEVIEKELS